MRGSPLSVSETEWESRPPATVDIELRPDPDVAAPDVTKIWGGEVTLNNVPVVNGNAGATNAGAKGGR